MKTPLRLTVIFSLLVASLSARLDESEEQLIHRYGRVRLRAASNVALMPGAPAGETLVFCVDGCTIKALVVGGRCHGIAYAKSGDWTEEQLWHILETNGGHALWEETPSSAPDFSREWKRRDRAVAVWQKSQGIQLLSRLDNPADDGSQVACAANTAALPSAVCGDALVTTD